MSCIATAFVTLGIIRHPKLISLPGFYNLSSYILFYVILKGHSITVAVLAIIIYYRTRIYLDYHKTMKF